LDINSIKAERLGGKKARRLESWEVGRPYSWWNEVKKAIYRKKL